MSTNVIAIDGPSYVGKSSVAQALARLQGYTFVNTGHMYRSVAKLCMDNRVAPEAREDVVRAARAAKIRFESGTATFRTYVNGEDWTEKLDHDSIVLFASKIAVIPELRDHLTQLQRSYAREQTIVMEGRDIGSVVFPDAVWKFYITASADVRARRMFKMMTDAEKKAAGDYKKLLPKIDELDEADRSRKIAPLRRAEDAIVYDNSDSPEAMQDALILQYYITHGAEVVENAALLARRVEA
ncbi:MAG TPA: (d)CMP kinase [Verrucomicrobiae bacterium]|nr:(d)CMP kinase [Verrucomicrobiae bacterium]